MAHLVADRRADARRNSTAGSAFGVEEGRLKDRGREGDLVHASGRNKRSSSAAVMSHKRAVDRLWEARKLQIPVELVSERMALPKQVVRASTSSDE